MSDLKSLMIPPKSMERVSDDFELARDNLLQLIATCSQSIEALSQLADQSQNARYYEALSALVGQMVNANRELLALQKTIRGINKEDPIQQTNVQNNTLVCTTDDLLKLMQGKTINGRDEEE